MLILVCCSNGDQPNSCYPVGRYGAGKGDGEQGTTYVPCCPGLNEIPTQAPSKDTAGADMCSEVSGGRAYACIVGTCGDGLCEEPEKLCGCPEDCGGPTFQTRAGG